ncbi:transporter [Bacillus cereus]|uniref:Transporter n=2 Tax=Bacillus cereus TaxID=1396 RepID=A0A9X0GDR1_BACCE|nr:transporter [Bacillus cereus]
MNEIDLILKAISTIALWLYLFPEMLKPSNVPFRFLLDIFLNDLAGTFFSYMFFSIGYVIYFIFVVFMSHKVIWSNTLAQKN